MMAPATGRAARAARLTGAGASLDAATFEAAREEGLAMGFGQAVALALEVDPPASR